MEHQASLLSPNKPCPRNDVCKEGSGNGNSGLSKIKCSHRAKNKRKLKQQGEDTCQINTRVLCFSYYGKGYGKILQIIPRSIILSSHVDTEGKSAEIESRNADWEGSKNRIPGIKKSVGSHSRMLWGNQKKKMSFISQQHGSGENILLSLLVFLFHTYTLEEVSGHSVSPLSKAAYPIQCCYRKQKLRKTLLIIASVK